MTSHITTRIALNKLSFQCLGVDMAYKDPMSGAEQMFNFVIRYLQKHLVTESSNTWSWREGELAQHDAFAATRSSIFIGGQDSFDQLDQHVQSGNCVVVFK